MSSANTTTARRRGVREYSADVTFGKAYDARMIRRLWDYVVPHKSLFTAALISYPIASGLHLIQPYLVKVAIDEHLIPKQPNGFGWIVVLFVLAIVLEFGARFGQTYLTQLLGQRATLDLRAKLFDKLQLVDVAYIERNPIGRLMTRVTNDVESLSEMFSTGAVSIIGDLVTLTGIVVMMLVLDWKLTLYTFSIVPFLIITLIVFRRFARGAFRDVRRELARLNGFLNEAISGMTLIQVFRQQREALSEFDDINRSYRDANLRSIRYDALTYAIVEGVGTVSIAGLLLFGLGMFEQGVTQIGVLVAFIDYVRRFFGPITELSTKYTVMQSAMASAERCFDLLDEEPGVLPSTRAGERIEGPVEHIRFEGVEFGYGSGELVLHGLDLEIPRGQKIAIVGPTGAGKSTIVKLLCRFYDPRVGRLSMNDIDFRQLELEDLRSKYAVVLQDPYLFDGTIRENVTLGRDIDQARLDDAAERTRAIEVIRKLESGWETRVGERGSRLSSGERQLIAFARALAYDPEVLILDEATSAVDPETEALIQEGLKALLESRTSVVIAHRLSTVRQADQIVVLSAGRTVEQGSHDDLMQLGGIYRNLYELQFENESSE